MNIFDKKDDLGQLQLCATFLTAKLYVFEAPVTETYNFFNMTYTSIVYKELPNVTYFWKRIKVPVLLCGAGASNIFLAKHSEHEGHVIFSEDDNMFRPVGFLINSYKVRKYEPIKEKEVVEKIINGTCKYI